MINYTKSYLATYERGTYTCTTQDTYNEREYTMKLTGVKRLDHLYFGNVRLRDLHRVFGVNCCLGFSYQALGIQRSWIPCGFCFTAAEPF